MQVISLKDYAKNNNISYEAVRKQVIRYASELEGHVIKDGRQQFLDENAVAFLSEKRKKNPVIIYEIAKDEEIDRLKQEKENLLLKLASVQDQLIQAQEQNRLLNEENRKIFLLEADNERAKKEAENARLIADQEKERAITAEKEKKEAEIRVSELERKEKETSSALDEVKEQLKNTETVAEINAQERDLERLRAEAAEQELLDLKEQNDALWARLEESTKRNFFQRLSDGIVKFFSE